MQPAIPTTSRNNKTPRKSLAKSRNARFEPGAVPMSHCYIQLKTAKINRKPRRLEIVVSHTKQTPTTQINRHLSCTLQNHFLRAKSALIAVRSGLASDLQPRPADRVVAIRNSSLITSHSSLALSRRTCQGAKKQQIHQSHINPLGLYFLASYAHFTIGRQRALVHDGGTEVAAGYNKNRAALAGMETQS
jgi:hypothetical protein